MRYSAKWLGLVVLTALMVPAIQLPGLAQNPTDFTQLQIAPTLAQTESAEDRKARADALFAEALQLWRISQFKAAQEKLQQALALYQVIGDKSGEARTLSGLGTIAESLGQFSQALDYLQSALSIQQSIDDPRGEAAILNNIGAVYESLGDYEEALSIHQDALSIYRAIGDRTGEGTSLNNIGSVHKTLTQYEQALTFFRDALAIYQDIDNRLGEGGVLNNIGSVYRALGQYEQALRFFQDALSIRQEIGDRAGEGTSLNNIGAVYRALGQYEQALRFYQDALTIRQEIGDRAGESAALNGLGLVYNDLGHYNQALAFYQDALTISQVIGDRRREATILNNMGATYHFLGQRERALSFYQNALAIHQASRDRLSKATTLINLGLLHTDLGQYEQALTFYNDALVIYQVLGEREGIGQALHSLGIVHDSLGQYEQALAFYQDALAIRRSLGDLPGEGITLGNLGTVHHKLKQYEQALSFHQDAQDVLSEVGDLRGQAIALNNQGFAFIEIGQLPKAELVLRQSIEFFESLRTALPDDQLIAIADTQASAYAALEVALLAQGKTAEALAITERGRAQAFALQLASRLPTSSEQADLANPPIADPYTIAEIQQTARDTNSTLVTYSLIFDQLLFIWVVQSSGTIEFRSVELGDSRDSGLAFNPIAAIDGPVYRSAADESELTELVADSRASIIVESIDTQPDQLKELHKVLIDPIADLLPPDPEAKVVFVPQDSLFLVPFPALQAEDGTYLIEEHTILTAPSIEVFGLANEVAAARSSRASRQSDNALIVGDPVMPTVWTPTASGDFSEAQLSALPGAKTEAEEIGDFLKVTPLIGDQATEAQIKQQLPSASLIHLATHGLLDYGDPRAYGTLDFPGAIALTPGDGEDGLLTSAEILEMELQADLAILSACDTGRGRIIGDGVVGLSRSLITAGVPSVVVSLWQVPDAPTAELMTEFYRQLDQGHDNAQALRQAMLMTLKQRPNPRNWAAFTLMGAAN